MKHFQFPFPFHLSWIILLFLISMSCRKDPINIGNDKIAFSTDTLKFDTVFTTLGSVTRSFKVYNRLNKKIKFTNIRLESSNQKFFRMNIDGTPTKNISNVEIESNDSIYIFVALTVDPSNDTLPFIINDKILFSIDGNEQSVALQAYGQNAHYIYDSILSSQTWTNDLPYVILGSGALVDTGAILTIQKGCRIYMNATAKLYVAGTLYIYGTKEDSVIFQGNRLDRDYFGYRDFPGEWGGIHFLGTSKQNILNYTILKNGGGLDASVYVQPTSSNDKPVVQMNQCKIENSSGYGILCFNTNIELNSCLIHTCGLQNLALVEGGNYQINHCTIATYGGRGSKNAQKPSGIVINYRDTKLSRVVGANLNAQFKNCIIYGSLDNELYINQKGSWDYNVHFDNCLIKRSGDFSIANTNQLILNTDPLFIDVSKWDFHIPTNSPAKGTGQYILKAELMNDLDGTPRQNPPSIGCYEAN